MPATLSLYIARRFSLAVLSMLAALSGLVSLFDFIELLRRSATKPDATFGLVTEIAALRLPYVSMQILPFAVLLGGILAFWRLTRSSELIVARAAGVSAWQFLAAPLACAVLVTGVAFLAIRSTSFTIRKRVLPMILALMALPVLIVVAATSNSVRLLTVLSGNAQGLSGRDIIWPYFEAVFARSPIFGWGLGAGKAVMDPDSLTVKLLGTTAAHNEYLRMGVEGGYIGITVVMLFMTLWTWRWTARIMRSDRIIIRLIMVGYAVQSITDNTLIAPTASILFTWMSAVFARGFAEADQATHDVDSVAEASPQFLPQA